MWTPTFFDRLCIALIKTFQHLNNHTRCPGNPVTPVSPFVDTYAWKKNINILSNWKANNLQNLRLCFKNIFQIANKIWSKAFFIVIQLLWTSIKKTLEKDGAFIPTITTLDITLTFLWTSLEENHFVLKTNKQINEKYKTKQM